MLTNHKFHLESLARDVESNDLDRIGEALVRQAKSDAPDVILKHLHDLVTAPGCESAVDNLAWTAARNWNCDMLDLLCAAGADITTRAIQRVFLEGADQPRAFNSPDAIRTVLTRPEIAGVEATRWVNSIRSLLRAGCDFGEWSGDASRPERSVRQEMAVVYGPDLCEMLGISKAPSPPPIGASLAALAAKARQRTPAQDASAPPAKPGIARKP